MELDDLKTIWKQQKVEEKEYLSKDQLVMLLNNKMISFDQDIKKRDRLEIGVAVVMSLICGVLLFILDSIWFKLACVTTILASGLIYIKLRNAQPTTDNAATAEHSFKKLLQVELQKVKAQKKLLQSVLSWYLAPFFVGYVFFLVGFGFYWFITASFSIFGLILYGYIWKLNQDAVADKINPIIDDIKEAIEFLDSKD